MAISEKLKMFKRRGESIEIRQLYSNDLWPAPKRTWWGEFLNISAGKCFIKEFGTDQIVGIELHRIHEFQ